MLSNLFFFLSLLPPSLFFLSFLPFPSPSLPSFLLSYSKGDAKGDGGWRRKIRGKRHVCHKWVSSVLLVSVMMTTEKIFLTAPASPFQQLPTSHSPNAGVPWASPHTVESAVM